MAIAIDASTPVKVSSATNTSAGHTAVTTASFTPPAGARLLAFCGANNPSAGQTHTPVVSGGSLTWTKAGQSSNGQNSGTDGMAAVFYADVVSSTAMTVTLDDGNASSGTTTGWDAYLKVAVITGGASTAPPTLITHSTPTGTPTVTMTVAAGSALFAVNSDWSAGGTATAGANTTVYDEYLSAGQISVHVFRSTSLALSAGSNTISVTPATQQFNLIGVEVQLPGASSSSGDVYWPLVRARATGPRQLSGPYSRQFQFGVDAPTNITTPLTIAVTGSSTVAALRGVQKLITVTAAPTITVVRAVGKTVAATGSGTVGVLRAVGKTLAVTGSSAASVALTKVKLVALAVTGSSTVGVVRQVGKITATTGTSTVTAVKALARGITTNGTGIVTTVRSVRLVRTITGTGTVALLRAVSLRASAVGTSTASLLRRVALHASTTGTGIVSVARNAFTGGTQFPVSIAVTAASTVKVVRAAGITTRATGSAVVSVARRAAVTAQVIGSATVATLRRLPITVRATGTAVVGIARRAAITARLTGTFALVVRVVAGAAQATIRGWSRTDTTSPSSSTSQADTTTTSKATVTIL